MANRITPHIDASRAGQNLVKMQRNLAKAFAKLASANRIPEASDDAAGLAIGTRLDARVRSLSQHMRSASDAISVVRTAEGGQDQLEVGHLEPACPGADGARQLEAEILEQHDHGVEHHGREAGEEDDGIAEAQQAEAEQCRNEGNY